jgi:glycosyltransferase involved in cell wall biosynthesis
VKILVATPYLFPHGGGLERYAHTLSAQLEKDGHEVVALGHSAELTSSSRRIGVLPRWKLSNTPVSSAIFREARRLLREGVDVVSLHTPVPGTAELVAYAARRERVPYVVTYHAGMLAAPPGPLRAAAWAHRNSFERAMIDRASARIAVSPYVAQNVYRERPSTIVPPGVDTARFRPCADEVPGRILFVGPVDRAYAWKGFDVLFQAFLDLALRDPQAHLRAVGHGDLVESYQMKAKAAGLADRISFAGRLPDDALPLEYSQASVLVLPSTSPAESFGMVLAEANACGRAVVGSRVGGIPFFVEDGINGLLAQPGDARDLARQIETLLADGSLRAKLGEAGRLKVRAHHRWSALAQQTAAVLEAARARGGRARFRSLPRGVR